MFRSSCAFIPLKSWFAPSEERERAGVKSRGSFAYRRKAAGPLQQVRYREQGFGLTQSGNSIGDCCIKAKHAARKSVNNLVN